MNYDVIGDIHGHADKLRALLRQLGYRPAARSWVPPAGHMAVFVGDLIDRGPQQREVVAIVRAMQDAGHARCVLGNHEFNAIAFATLRESGGYLRPRSEKNLKQHAEFLAQVGQDSAAHREMVAWFSTLPPALDLGGIRVAHAWWDDAFVQLVHNQMGSNRLEGEFLQRACTRGTPEWVAMEGLTKGHEVPLPAGHSFADHEGVQRHEARARWWLDQPASYRDFLIVPAESRDSLPQAHVPPHWRRPPVSGAPIVVGHYWYEGQPRLESRKVACVDYSAAKEGPLVCYRWQGEAELVQEHFVASGARQ